jgi:RNA polymerase sigma factor (TIGR02999 family)
MVLTAHSKTDRLLLLVDRASGRIEWGLANHDSLGGAPMSEVTEILGQIADGDGQAAEKLLPLVYDELRKLAAAKMAQEKPGQTLDATGLVHEAYLRLVDVDKAQYWNSRGHFFSAAAEAMRRILIEQAHKKKRQRHGGQLTRVPFEELELATTLPPDELLLLNDAIDALAAHDPVASQLVKICYFAGLSVEQAAQALGISRSTAYEHWTYARAWLFASMRDARSNCQG